jgi:hypothetical protein
VSVLGARDRRDWRPITNESNEQLYCNHTLGAYFRVDRRGRVAFVGEGAGFSIGWAGVTSGVSCSNPKVTGGSSTVGAWVDVAGDGGGGGGGDEDMISAGGCRTGGASVDGGVVRRRRFAGVGDCGGSSESSTIKVTRRFQGLPEGLREAGID